MVSRKSVYFSLFTVLVAAKEEAARFAALAVPQGYQVLAIDLPEHGARTDAVRLLLWQTVPELRAILHQLRTRWPRISLHATSIGMWLSLQAFCGEAFDLCLFVSPLLDMTAMIHGMMAAAGVDEVRLAREKEIPTASGQTLSWDYLCWARAHPVRALCPNTQILYSSGDTLIPHESVEAFAAQNGCRLTILDGGEHWLHTPDELSALARWEAAALTPKEG